MHYLSFGIRLWLALVCAVAVVGKARGRRSFGDFVTSLELAARSVPLVRAPARFARLAAAPILVAEAATAVLLPLPATALAGGVLAVLLFAGFTAGVMVAVATGAEAPCACFGRISRRLGWSDAVRDAVLLAAAGVALAVGAGDVAPAGGVSAAVAALVATLVVVFWSDIAALFAAPGVVVETEVSR
jgi:hypothetical protein